MIINANALSIPLASNSVHCVVTSPPYWGLRDYGTATWEGGDPGCDHNPQKPDGGERSDRTLPLGRGGMYKSVCAKCGAVRIDNQLGLEATPEEYVANMVAVFREVWRVLRDDGTLWLNLGDSYAGSGGHSPDSPASQPDAVAERGGFGVFDGRLIKDNRYTGNGLKPKDLVGIPWRLAFALQADGWYLRSDIIWSKPNPMPESVTDRPTKAHEYIFLLAKRARYYYDADAVREEYLPQSVERSRYASQHTGQRYGKHKPDWNDKRDPEAPEGTGTNPAGRNRRTVWTIPTAPYKGAHFATFPPALVEPCIKAGTSERGVCPKCGAPWVRVVEKQKPPDEMYVNTKKPKEIQAVWKTGGMGQKLQDWYNEHPSTTLGWRPSCECDAGEPIPALVFDPFAGSGTTVKVAYDLGRRGVGLDLSLEYLTNQAHARIHNGHAGRLL